MKIDGQNFETYGRQYVDSTARCTTIKYFGKDKHEQKWIWYIDYFFDIQNNLTGTEIRDLKREDWTRGNVL